MLNSPALHMSSGDAPLRSAPAISPPASADVPWELELADLLSELASVQSELLEVLDAKRGFMGRGDIAAADALQPRTQDLLARLHQCHERRARLLAAQAGQDAESGSLSKLAGRATREKRDSLARQVKEASLRMRLLHHQSLSNWVLAQRSLLHIAQMLEIIATGGRLQATYGQRESTSPGGALVDEAA